MKKRIVYIFINKKSINGSLRKLLNMNKDMNKDGTPKKFKTGDEIFWGIVFSPILAIIIPTMLLIQYFKDKKAKKSLEVGG